MRHFHFKPYWKKKWRNIYEAILQKKKAVKNLHFSLFDTFTWHEFYFSKNGQMQIGITFYHKTFLNFPIVILLTELCCKIRVTSTVIINYIAMLNYIWHASRLIWFKLDTNFKNIFFSKSQNEFDITDFKSNRSDCVPKL